jgi:CheY-like chemotaxis protein/HPt (histidine-containing phosphotransfer) domain-containing protein
MSEKNVTAPGPGTTGAATVAPADVARIWAVMSHEIRTPLMGVVGMLEVLNRTSLSDEQRRIISTAEESSVALMRIIDDVLDFAKLEAAQVKLEESIADPVAILEGTADLLATIAGTKRLTLTCEVEGALPLVLCDALRLRQVLLNIGANAVKYTETGTVALMASMIGGKDGAATLRFSVIDTGQGVPLDLQGYLFEPFWQLAGREASLNGMGGVGLGLAICRTLVDAMGGQIAVDSRPSEGTRFDVDVTFKIASEAKRPRLEDVEVVTVDTGDAALGIAARYLEGAGANIVRVETLGALSRYVPAAKKRVIVLLGADTESEDVEATSAALQRMGSERLSSIVWLHRGTAGGLPVRSGVWPVRANPMRRGDLFAAITKTSGEREGDGVAIVARRQERLIDPNAVVQAARADGMVILVAEDNKVNQEVLRQQLAILGYDCDIASTGHAALKKLGERSYPLLLCDCHMPGMDGFELTRTIRNSERDSDARMPIVAVTANAVPGEAQRCRAAGMDDYLAKPIEISALQAKLSRWIKAQQAYPTWSGGAAIPAAAPAERLLDLRGLSVVYGNDPQRLAPVLEQWSSGMTEVLRDLEASVDARAWESALAATHRIKGSAGVAGAARVSAAAAALEVALRGGNAAAIAQERTRVRTLTQASLHEAAEWRRQASA